ncbi:MAG: hypothetical protein DMD62_11225 [Gemmatimonadetes bacterium]|nr:MAG: hypothetical protein DMD62_11225 [Gemmatimonadota bacterium]
MLRRALVIVPLLSAVMLNTRPDNYFACTMFPGPDGTQLQLVFVVHYAPVPSGAHQVVLLVSDQQSYPCMNYQLDGGMNVAGQTIRVTMSGSVIKPDVCMTATGPAQYQTALPVAPGTYDLDFERGASLDRYRLTVTTSAISITTVESSFTRPAGS